MERIPQKVYGTRKAAEDVDGWKLTAKVIIAMQFHYGHCGDGHSESQQAHMQARQT